MTNNPIPNGSNGGRSADGRFAKGNPGGPGNPAARKVAELRKTLLEVVTDEDLRAIVCGLVRKAREGDLLATREVLDRVLGKTPTLTHLKMMEEGKWWADFWIETIEPTPSLDAK